MNSRGERLNELQEIIRKTKKERGLALESLTQAGEEAAERRKELLQVEQEEELRRKVKIAKVCERKMRQMKHSIAHSAISRALNQWNARSSACILQIAALEKKRVARAREAELARLLEEDHRHAEDAAFTCSFCHFSCPHVPRTRRISSTGPTRRPCEEPGKGGRGSGRREQGMENKADNLCGGHMWISAYTNFQQQSQSPWGCRVQTKYYPEGTRA